jgi:hypothetical protein
VNFYNILRRVGQTIGGIWRSGAGARRGARPGAAGSIKNGRSMKAPSDGTISLLFGALSSHLIQV